MTHARSVPIADNRAPRPAVVIPDTGGDPERILAWLLQGDVARAMTAVMTTLGDGATTLEDVRFSPHWRRIRELVIEGEWFERLAPRRPVSAARPAPSAIGRAIDAWLLTESATLRAARARDRYLARLVGDAAGGSGRRIQVLAPSLGGLQAPAVHTVNASLHALLSREYQAFGCSLVVVPLLPGTLPREAHETLLQVLTSWLQPGGELVVSAFCRLPEAAFLQAMLGWQPALVASDTLLRMGTTVEDGVASLRYEHEDGVAHLHVQRR